MDESRGRRASVDRTHSCSRAWHADLVLPMRIPGALHSAKAIRPLHGDRRVWHRFCSLPPPAMGRASPVHGAGWGHQSYSAGAKFGGPGRSEEHTSELQSLMRISYAVFCLKKKINESRLYDTI